jgi:4-hydroxythreonine-4-phosphate dehydrogenase
LSKRAERGHELPIVISMGEPSGIGPEIAVAAFAHFNGAYGGRMLRLIGNRAVFAGAAARLSLDMAALDAAILDTGHAVSAEPGRADVANTPAVIGAIEVGAALCLKGEAAALVTAPIMKSVLTRSGFGFPGHTEFLAHLSGASRAVMMLASEAIEPPLRVVPFTIHIALKDVFADLDADAIAKTASIVLGALTRDFGCEHPRLAFAGLNPHAGESGTMGREEIEVLAPVIAKLRASGADVLGPLSADTLFHTEARKGYDAALCLYHDQALIPIKTLAFWSGVNVTLGLPIVRTSPDHGTALDIAGKRRANPQSMIAAIAMAADIAARRGL